MQRMLPTLPILRIDPALPMLRMLPALPMLRIEAKLPTLKSDAALVTLSTLNTLRTDRRLRQLSTLRMGTLLYRRALSRTEQTARERGLAAAQAGVEGVAEAVACEVEPSTIRKAALRRILTDVVGASRPLPTALEPARDTRC